MDQPLNTGPVGNGPEGGAAPATAPQGGTAPATGQPGGQPTQGAASDGNGNLILGRFKSPDELASAYTSLQAEYTRLKQQGTQTRPQQPQYAPQPNVGAYGQPQNPFGGVDPNVLNEAFQLAWEHNPMAVLQNLTGQVVQQHLSPVQQENQRLRQEMKLLTFAMEHQDDLKQVAPLMAPILQAAPQLLDMPAVEVPGVGVVSGLEFAYLAAKGQLAPQIAHQAHQQGQQQAHQQFASAALASSVGGGGGQPTPQADPVEQLFQMQKQLK